MSDELRDLERRIRDWATRPTATSPRSARTRVLARIAERRRWASWRLPAAASLLAVGLVSGLLVFTPAELDPPAGAPAEQPSPRLLVYQLESGTKLYLALAATAVHTPTPSSPHNGTGNVAEKGNRR